MGSCDRVSAWGRWAYRCWAGMDVCVYVRTTRDLNTRDRSLPTGVVVTRSTDLSCKCQILPYHYSPGGSNITPMVIGGTLCAPKCEFVIYFVRVQ